MDLVDRASEATALHGGSEDEWRSIAGCSDHELANSSRSVTPVADSVDSSGELCACDAEEGIKECSICDESNGDVVSNSFSSDGDVESETSSVQIPGITNCSHDDESGDVEPSGSVQSLESLPGIDESVAASSVEVEPTVVDVNADTSVTATGIGANPSLTEVGIIVPLNEDNSNTQVERKSNPEITPEIQGSSTDTKDDSGDGNNITDTPTVDQRGIADRSVESGTVGVDSEDDFLSEDDKWSDMVTDENCPFAMLPLAKRLRAFDQEGLSRDYVALACRFRRGKAGRVAIVDYSGNILLDLRVRQDSASSPGLAHVGTVTDQGDGATAFVTRELIDLEEVTSLVLRIASKYKALVGFSIHRDLRVLNLSEAPLTCIDPHNLPSWVDAEKIRQARDYFLSMLPRTSGLENPCTLAGESMHEFRRFQVEIEAMNETGDATQPRSQEHTAELHAASNLSGDLENHASDSQYVVVEKATSPPTAVAVTSPPATVAVNPAVIPSCMRKPNVAPKAKSLRLWYNSLLLWHFGVGNSLANWPVLQALKESEPVALVEQDCVALDCTWVFKGYKRHPVRVCMVDSGGRVLMDAFVKPPSGTLRYNTLWSGITEEVLETANAAGRMISREEALREMWSHIRSSDCVIGHRLSRDFETLGIDEENLTYTDISEKDGIQQYPGLRGPLKKHCGVVIQRSRLAHDSLEDAAASMLLYKVLHKA